MSVLDEWEKNTTTVWQNNNKEEVEVASINAKTSSENNTDIQLAIWTFFLLVNFSFQCWKMNQMI